MALQAWIAPMEGKTLITKSIYLVLYFVHYYLLYPLCFRDCHLRMLWESKYCFISSQQNTKRISKEESKNLVETTIGWNNHLTVLWPTSTTSDRKIKKGLYTLYTFIFNQNFIICSSSDKLSSLCWHLQGSIAVQPIAFRSAFNSVCNARFSQFKQQPMDKIKSLSTIST